MRFFIALGALATLITGCGGSGGTSMHITETNSTSMTMNNPPQARTRTSTQLQNSNFSNLEWYVDPQVDLPRDGRGGLRVIRPEQRVRPLFGRTLIIGYWNV